MSNVISLGDGFVMDVSQLPGGGRRLAITRDGVYTDGPDGLPCTRWYRKDGTLSRLGRYTDGLRNDGPNGEPAFQNFGTDGTITSERRFQHGLRQPELAGDHARRRAHAAGESCNVCGKELDESGKVHVDGTPAGHRPAGRRSRLALDDFREVRAELGAHLTN